MNNLLKHIEDTLFSAEDTVCLERARLVTEAFAQNETKSMPELRSQAFSHVLTNMSLDLTSNPVFAGNTSTAPRAWMLVPEFGFAIDRQIEIEHSELEKFLEGKIPDDLRSFWTGRQFGGTAGIGHMGLDFDLVVNQGLESILTNIEQQPLDATADQVNYRNAMSTCCRTVIRWANRYADAAEKQSAHVDSAIEKQCLERIAAACRHVPAKPARNLFEGLQAIALVHLASYLEGQGMSMSIGLPDRALNRFADEVEQSPTEAIELIRAFLLKIAATSFEGRGSKTQAITIGGSDGTDDACSAITLAFLKAFEQTPVNDPHVFFRWHRDVDEACWQQCLSMLSQGRNMPLLVNDHQVIPGLIKAGVTDTDASEYCIIGCNELGIPGRCCQSGFNMGLGFDELQMLDQTVREVAAADSAVSIPAILSAYKAKLKQTVSTALENRRQQNARHIENRPFPFCSACCQGTVEAGEDLLAGLPYSNIYGLFTRGTSNAINVLATIQELVLQSKRWTLSELINGIDQQDPELLDAIRLVPKWGNDIDAVDVLGKALNDARSEALHSVAHSANIPRFAVCHVVRSLHHLDGMNIGNTLDGRPSGSPVADSLGAVLGTQTEGPTALLNSVSKIDAVSSFPGIYNLNLTLPTGSQASVEVIKALTEAFFFEGGQELQINVLDATELRQAREHPEKHRDLVVRIAGLNARFVELSDLEQQEIIARATEASTTSA